MQDKNPRYVHINIRKHPTHHLTDEEKDNPYLVFEHLYDDEISVTDFRDLLWKSFLATITGNYCELSPEEREDVVFVYERLKKMIDAAHIINEHAKLRGKQGQHHFVVEEEEEEELYDEETR
jgi:hypothetical protein